MDAPLHTDVAAWFGAAYPGPTPPQRAMLDAHARAEHALLCSPTGTGKTLAAFLGILSDLHRLAEEGALADGIQCVYVSPLRALTADVARNLATPLEQIAARIRAQGRAPPPLRVAVRTGDTDERERRQQREAPPHVLATTPETLAILLNAPRLSLALAKVRHVVVDEVHALAGTKRGAHLALALERLERLVVRAGRSPPVRLGLSATVAQPREVAAFLAGARPVRIIETPVPRDLALDVRAPVPDLASTDPDAFEEGLVGLLDEIVQAHRTTLVFTSTRRAAERVVALLRARHPQYAHALEMDASEDPAFVAPDAGDALAPHHGSMSRESRWVVETRLQRGELRCVVASASLELGIDVGEVDHVVLLGSPRDAARALQRIGRSGHRIDATRRATLVALDPDDLLECLALRDAIEEGRLAPLPPTPAALDVLAQHLCGLALERPLTESDALALARASGPYARLAREDVERAVDALAAEGLLRRDARGRIAPGPWLTRERYARNVGAIVATGAVHVRHGARFVGEVDEAFVESLAPGDALRLAGESWRFVRALGGVAWVEPAPGVAAGPPDWAGEGLPLGAELATAAAARLTKAIQHLPENATALTVERLGLRVARPSGARAGQTHGLDESIVTMESLAGYASLQGALLAPGTMDEWPVETFVDDEGLRVTVVHAPLGRRVNEALARLVAQARVEEGREPPRVVAADAGFALATPRGEPPARATLLRLARDARDIDDRLREAARASPRFTRRLQQVLARFLLARTPDARGPPAQAQARLHAHRRDERSPLHEEALREVLEEAWDAAGAREALASLRSDPRRLGALRKLPCMSPRAVGIVLRLEAAPARERVLAQQDAYERARDALAWRRARER